MAEYRTALLRDGFRYLEGPRWRAGRLWMSDMWDGKVYALDPAGAAEVVAEVPNGPSGLGFLPDGTLLVVSMGDRRVLRLDDGRLACHADLSALSRERPNDMVVDRRGRAYVGDFGYDICAGAAMAPANLVLVLPSGEARVAAEDLAFPNGAVILDGGDTLVVAESLAGRLTAFEIAADGSLANRRLYADLGDQMPDGLCLDREGAIWVSSFEHDVFLRVRAGGEAVDRVPVPGRRAVACQLGGNDGRTLFCLTCETTWEEVCAGRGRARVETARVAVPGAGSP